MSLLHRYFGRDEHFFQFLEAGAAEAEAAAKILLRLLQQIGSAAIDETMGEIAQSRRKHKRISHEITALLCHQSITPLERQDIEELSTALYKITKNVEKIAERMTICPPGADLNTLTRQISLLDQGAAVVVKMVNALRARWQSDGIKDQYEQLQAIEGDADRVMNELLKGLYQSDFDARLIVFWKDLFELLEKGIDRCRDAGFVVFHVVLKNS